MKNNAEYNNQQNTNTQPGFSSVEESRQDGETCQSRLFDHCPAGKDSEPATKHNKPLR